MSATWKKRVGSIIGLILLCAAAIALYRQLREHSVSDILAHLGAIPVGHFLLAMLFTVLSFTALTCYDTLALRYLLHPLPYRKIAMASFVSYAFAHSMGFSIVSGSSVRYRLYSAWGLTTAQIAKVVLFNTVTAVVGLLALGGIALVAFPIRIPHLQFLHSGSRMLGLLEILGVLVYLLMSAMHRGKFRIGKREFAPPTIDISFLQIVICCADLCFAASVLYFLMPVTLDVPYIVFVAMYVLAYVVGQMSQVPGGLGVFDTGMILLLTNIADPAAVLGSLLAFRVLYYVVPLFIAVGWLGVHEVFAHHSNDLGDNAGS